jgi:DNA polymerase-3 subunit beta
MKITASTGAIADAFVLAASLSADDKCAKKIATLEAIRIKTADSAALVSGNILDHAVSITVPATIEIPGELAVSGSCLAALANGFARTETIMITAEGKTARVDCSRSRFKLATIPLDDLPAHAPARRRDWQCRACARAGAQVL